MERSYQLTRAEYEHVNWRAIKERQGRLLAAFILIGAASIFLSTYNHHLFLTAAIFGVAALLLFSLTTWLIFRFVIGSTYKSLSRSPSWGEVTVRLESDRLITATHLIKTEIRWEAVTKISEDAKGFYLYLNPLQVIMVPQRVFADAAEAQTFWTLTQEYYQHARRTPIRG